MSLLFAACLFAAILDQPGEANSSRIRTMPVARSAEASTIVLRIAVPKDGQVVKTPVWIQFRIDGFALGSGSSQLNRASDLVESKMGQTVRVVIDNHPFIPINEPAIAPFNESGYYYDTSYKFEVPLRLKEGMHTIRMFPARSFGEGVKGEQAFATSVFYVGKKEDNLKVDLSQPYLTYNEPSPDMYFLEDKPILLDFYVSNTELSTDGYKVRLTIDGKVNRTITAWQPYYIYGLAKGSHTIRLELLDPENKLVPGLFNDVRETITVH